MKVKELESQIDETNKKISDLRSKKAYLMGELRDAKQVEFETTHGVKSGDKLTTKGGTTYYYDRLIITAYSHILVLCHPVKNDGTASKADRHVDEEDF